MNPLILVWVPTGIVLFFILVFLLIGIQIVRPQEVRLVERLGKYVHTLLPGFNFVIPIVDRVTAVNMTEVMIDVEPQTIITKDKLSVMVDAIVYYKIIDPVKAIFQINDFEDQIVSLARTTLRSVLGTMSFADSNEKRDEINTKIEQVLTKEILTYGVQVLRVEIQKFQPPTDVIESMNKVLKAEQEKLAATELAKAKVEQAKGLKEAAVMEATGLKEAAILKATGEAEAIKLVNTSIRENFKDEARYFKALEVVGEALGNNTKYFVQPGTNLVNLIGDTAGIHNISDIIKQAGK